MIGVLIAGGGTGGHLFPGIALAQELRRRSETVRILFVGTARGIETRAVPAAGFELALLPVSGLRRTGVIGMVIGLLRLPFAIVKALALVRRFKPSVAVSVGGYAAGPAVLASRLLGIPCVVMEQNAVPGFTNRVLARVARRVLPGLPTRGLPEGKVRVVGNPVRQDLLAVRAASYSPATPPRLLVFGGSQGARAINEAMMAAAVDLSALELSIVHQTGEADHDRVRDAYNAAGLDAEVHSFIDDMAAAYRDADLVLCRSGAMTIAELTVCGRPSILVPYPFAVDDHQSANAATLAEAGAAIHLPQTDLSPERLVALVRELAFDRERLERMATESRRHGKPDAAKDIADVLEAEARLGGWRNGEDDGSKRCGDGQDEVTHV